MDQQRGFRFMTEGERLREEGMARVFREPWATRARTMFHEIELPDEFIAEDIRAALLAAGLEEPHSPNAWGALTASLRDAKRIVATGAYRKPRDRKSHARKTQVYRRR